MTKWIKCNEALPELNTDCLIWNGYDMFMGYLDDFEDGEGARWYSGEFIIEASHWGELPEPPND